MGYLNLAKSPIPFRRDGQFNSEIPIEIWNELPRRWKRCWQSLDLNVVVDLINEDREEIQEESDTEILLSEDEKLQLKAEALGLDRKNKEKKL